MYFRDLTQVGKIVGMAEVEMMIKIKAPVEKIWDIISNVDGDAIYWKGISHISNLTKDGNTVRREVVLSDGVKGQQKITLFPKEGVHTKWTKGPISGTKDIMLLDNGNVTIIRVQIKYDFHKISQMRKSIILEELCHETEKAMKLIKTRAEHPRKKPRKNNR